MEAKHTDTCPHERTTCGAVYQYCEDCGAVRVRPELRPTDGAWHTCPECSLKRPALRLARGDA